jgi:hypothetical protein
VSIAQTDFNVVSPGVIGLLNQQDRNKTNYLKYRENGRLKNSRKILRIGAASVAMMLLVPMSVSAQSHGDNQQDPRELLEGGVKMMLQALELFINTIPQYEEPEVLENGDIIIRRKPKKLEQPSLDVDTEDDQIKM